jgi:enamine deaminase RidA (YjgF/YER057c/UK114 family)
MAHELINPPTLGPPRGYSNGVLAEPGGRLLFIAGQVAWDESQTIVSDELDVQFGRALENVVAVLKAAGGAPEHLVRLMIYVTDRDQYLRSLKPIGAAYRRVLGRHYPAMALVEVKALLEPSAKVEIEATAVLPASSEGEQRK